MNISIYNSYQVYLYSIQQSLYNYLSGSIIKFNVFTAILLFIMGSVSILTPCFISIIPLSVAYINSRYQIKYSKNIFISGILSAILLSSFLLNIINYKYITYFTQIPLLSSLFLCIIALNFLQVGSLSIINLDSSFLLNKIDKYIESNFYDYFTGFLIGLSSLPCSSSVLYIILFWLSKSINIGISSSYLLCYILGYISTILIVLNKTLIDSQIYFWGYIWELLIPFSGFIILTISVFNILQQIFY